MPGAQSQGSGSASGELQFCGAGRAAASTGVGSARAGCAVGRGGLGMRGRRSGNVPNLPLCFYNFLFLQVRGLRKFAANPLLVESGRFGTFAPCIAYDGEAGSVSGRSTQKLEQHTSHLSQPTWAFGYCRMYISRTVCGVGSTSWEASLGKPPPRRSCQSATMNASSRSYTHSTAGGRSTSGENPV